MRPILFALFFSSCFLLYSFPSGGTAVNEEVHIQGKYLDWSFLPEDGGILSGLNRIGSVYNLSDTEGLLQEGFGVGSYYHPNRRLNERLEILDSKASPLISSSYECDGPNIKGLAVTKLIEPIINESSIRVTWTIKNNGSESQWISPWVRNAIHYQEDSRVDLPTVEGMESPRSELFLPAARNWASLTDTAKQETVYGIFHADHVHAFGAVSNDEGHLNTIHTAYVPRFLKPGDAWTTIYRLNVARGLSHVDFATDEFALQLDYSQNQLTALLAPAKSMDALYLDARIVAPNKRVWKLPRKKFNASPENLSRFTYEWEAPADGTYEFLAQISTESGILPLGEDTGSPHGGIDAVFSVGNAGKEKLAPWTDAPFLLDRQGRIITRDLAVEGDVRIFFASSLEKIFQEDSVRSSGKVNPVHRICLAQNESESFQLCVAPAEDPLEGVTVHISDLIHSDGKMRINASDIDICNVRYHRIQIPSHYEGPTGWFPDALPPHRAFEAHPGEVTPVWITLKAHKDTKPGLYKGMIEIKAGNGGPWKVQIEAEVFDFALPDTPTLKTDFGFSLESLASLPGGGKPQRQLLQAWLDNALNHKITLRELCQFPRESGDYTAALSTYTPHMENCIRKSASTFFVPATLLDAPAQLEAANAYVRSHNLTGKAFTQLAYEPETPAWGRVLERMQQWKNLAPDIAVTVSTTGLKAFIPEALDIWTLHAQVMDTTQNADILARTSEGGEVWWYVNHMPPRPYGNFFIDFSPMEHRILFWQSWALGIKGMYYWSVNHWQNPQDPFNYPSDVTPVNGNGMLLYPGDQGPINSIRWEVIRDGIEDYDYLALLTEYRRRLSSLRNADALMKQAAEAYNLSEIIPSLVSYTQDPVRLQTKREALARSISAMKKALEDAR
ncbi:MAG: hypothetical protein BWY07_00102 [Candidatus Hydrogenedentes bacterium ADurb.Bin170]|nr:MAG: hypothetical protein BWY07_00102 [Candidatus Hydrogenedentes bacterium ADurb.Bin170]